MIKGSLNLLQEWKEDFGWTYLGIYSCDSIYVQSFSRKISPHNKERKEEMKSKETPISHVYYL